MTNDYNTYNAENSSFAFRLEAILKGKALTTTEFGEHIGQDPQVIRNWVANDIVPDKKIIQKILDVFDLPVWALVEPDLTKGCNLFSAFKTKD